MIHSFVEVIMKNKIFNIQENTKNASDLIVDYPPFFRKRT